MVAAWRGGRGSWRGAPLPLPDAAGLRLLLLLLMGAASPPPPGAQGRRLICWQAMLQCQEEADCGYAYSQYTEACAPVLRAAGDGSVAAAAAAAATFSNRRRCPSHCISALIQLNHTRRGPALEDCDCDQDENCRATKRAIEPCLPRTSGGAGGGGGGGAAAGGVIGCTEARRRCDWDSGCSLALSRYMAYCGKLFNGLRCTEQCRAVIDDMLAVPKAMLLNDCVCDGLERPICESVKENMARLCFGGDIVGPGSSGASDGAIDDYYDEDYEDEPSHRGKDELDDVAAVAGAGAEAAFPRRPGDGCSAPAAAPWTLLSTASILLLLLLS
ncbi:Growth arrest-specific protein 1 [Varanus komodoensis]|uniref:Growth arrest specific 1 n=1 Tax=Varanus komodoensis TaxID=61221 RepID=A0A8D2JHY3_VARKO|nr:growth arrest-specific protein 1 [Varanus komodoensis]KAF7250631.1 Growth arrest-specific protein 1 [Varanus komodoensis]